MVLTRIFVLVIAAASSAVFGEEPKCGERNGWAQVAPEDNELSASDNLDKYTTVRPDQVIDLGDRDENAPDDPQTCCNYDCSMNFTSSVPAGTQYDANNNCVWEAKCGSNVRGYVYRHFTQGIWTGTQINNICPLSRTFSTNVDEVGCKKVLQCFKSSRDLGAWNRCMGNFSSQSGPKRYTTKLDFGDSPVYALKGLSYTKSVQLEPEGRYSSWEVYSLRPDGGFDVVMA